MYSALPKYLSEFLRTRIRVFLSSIRRRGRSPYKCTAWHNVAVRVWFRDFSRNSGEKLRWKRTQRAQNSHLGEFRSNVRWGHAHAPALLTRGIAAGSWRCCAPVLKIFQLNMMWQQSRTHDAIHELSRYSSRTDILRLYKRITHSRSDDRIDLPPMQ